MKYNIGSNVKIKSKEWFDKNRELILINPDIMASAKYFMHLLEVYCGMDAIVVEKVIEYNGYLLNVDNGRFVWPEEFLY